MPTTYLQYVKLVQRLRRDISLQCMLGETASRRAALERLASIAIRRRIKFELYPIPASCRRAQHRESGENSGGDDGSGGGDSGDGGGDDESIIDGSSASCQRIDLYRRRLAGLQVCSCEPLPPWPQLGGFWDGPGRVSQPLNLNPPSSAADSHAPRLAAGRPGESLGTGVEGSTSPTASPEESLGDSGCRFCWVAGCVPRRHCQREDGAGSMPAQEAQA